MRLRAADVTSRSTEQRDTSAMAAMGAEPGCSHVVHVTAGAAAPGPAAQPAPATFEAQLEALHREAFRALPQLEEGELMVGIQLG